MEENSDKGTLFSKKRIFDYQGKQIDLSVPRVMGILNLAPDSFYDAERTADGGTWGQGDLGTGRLEDKGVSVAETMVKEGVYILDVGAVSTRPGADEVSIEEEKSRLLAPLREIRKHFPGLIISIDTFRSEVARLAAGEGADMINDISGGTFDKEMIPLVSKLGIPYVIMHIQGTPRNMQLDPNYDNVTEEVFSFLLNQALRLEKYNHFKTILDPGFGFGKTVAHNYELLGNLDRLADTGYPILAGLSRKSMINRVLGTTPASALNGTTVLNTIALMKGASILRVHDVREAVQAVKLVNHLIM